MSEEPNPHRATPLLVGIVLGVGLFAGLAQWSGDFDGATVGLGLNTSGKHGLLEGRRIDGRGDDIAEVATVARALREEGKDIVLWLGASQLHAINNQKDDDELAVVVANQRAIARKSPTRYVLLSEPNGNLHELWAMLHHMLDVAPPDAVVLGFTYDDLREPGVRPTLRHLYAAAPVDPSVLHASPVDTPATLETDDTPQVALEQAMTKVLTTVFPAYGSRDRTRSKLSALYRRGFSQIVFKVLRRPQERIPRDRAKWNMAAYRTMVDALTQRHIPLLVYQAPHRPGMQPFYHPRGAYDAFHRALADESATNHLVTFLDLEALVPAEEWGITNAGQPDVFHFTGRGHAALGRAIDDALIGLGW